MATDPVCGMEVDPGRAAASAEYRGVSYYFCAQGCKDKFVADPARYVQAEKEGFFKRLLRPR